MCWAMMVRGRLLPDGDGWWLGATPECDDLAFSAHGANRVSSSVPEKAAQAMGKFRKMRRHFVNLIYKHMNFNEKVRIEHCWTFQGNV